jgi:hypothetical protein
MASNPRAVERPAEWRSYIPVVHVFASIHTAGLSGGGQLLLA